MLGQTEIRHKNQDVKLGENSAIPWEWELEKQGAAATLSQFSNIVQFQFLLSQIALYNGLNEFICVRAAWNFCFSKR